MRAVLQRVSSARVTVGGEVVGSIGLGYLLLMGIEDSDGVGEAAALVEKVAGLRVFGDHEDKMNLDIGAAGGAILAVSQFTLLADVRRGRRPSFTSAGAPEHARRVFDHVVGLLRDRGLEVATGRFGEKMEVELVNHGPVTLVLDVKDGRVL